VGDERRGEVEPAPHAAGVRARRTVGGLADAELGEELCGPLAGVAAVQLVEPADEDDVLPTREVLVDGGELAGEADAGPHRLGLMRNVVTVHGAGTAVRAQHGGEHAHHRRLACAVGPEQAEHRALGDGEADALDRLHVAEVLLEVVGDDRTLCHSLDISGWLSKVND